MTPAIAPRRVLWITGWACDARTLHPLAAALGGKLDHGSVGWRDCLRDWRQGWGSEAEAAEATKSTKPSESDRSLKSAEPAAKPALSDPPGLPIVLAERLAESATPAVLVGWSLGGLLALRAAAAMPAAVAGLILIGAPARFTADPADPTDPAAPACLGAPPRPLWAMRRKLDSPDAVQQVLLDFFRAAAAPAGNEVLVVDLAARAAARFGQPALARGLDCLAVEDVRPWLPRVAAPCLALHGAADGIVAPGWAPWLAARLPRGRALTFPNQGHLLPLTATAEVAEAMRGFLNELAGQDGHDQ
jgi:pimeloyl-[acyl-carrier protein] methyl ester esterase